jgi:hypothetical protein
MLLNDAPQHLKHYCDEAEFTAYKDGIKAFGIKLNDGEFDLEEGDLVTIIARNAEGELTGNSITRRISYVLNTKKITNLDSKDLSDKGITIFSFVHEDYRQLDSLFAENFTMSVAIDRHSEGDSWEIVGIPSYTPTLISPEVASSGVLDNLNIDKWPEGKYSVTMLLAVDTSRDEPPYELSVLDLKVLAAAKGSDGSLLFVDLNPNAILGGHALNIETNEKVTLLSLDDFIEATAQSAPEENSEEYPELFSDEQLRNLIEEARERGEDVEDLDRAFLQSEAEE